MAKVGPKAPPGSPAAEPEDPQTQPGEKEKKKKKKTRSFWKQNSKQAEKKTPEGPKLPPKTLQEVSANWRALQELLKQKAALLNSSAPNTSSKKRNGTRTGGIVPQVNGTGAVPTPKPTEKAKKISADPPAQPGQTKGENNTDRKNVSLSQEDGKKHKRGRKRGRAEREHGAVQHKWQKTEEPADPQAADIWFDDVDPDDIEAALGPEAAKVARRNLGIREERRERLPEQVLVKESAFGGLTKAVAMDCEMVGVGSAGEESVAARVSIVNLFGKCIYDKYVKPTEKVTDYRTAVSGIRPEHLKAGEDFKVVQKEVASILKGRILVGHALHNDLKILFLDHPKKKIRDTQRYKPFKQQVKSGRPSLKLLCEKLLNVKVQTSEHSSVQDAQAAMRLYTMAKRNWEASLKAKSKAKKE